MKFLRNIAIISVVSILISSCGSNKDCPDAEIRWADHVMTNDIIYHYHQPVPVNDYEPIIIEKGKEIGKVTYKMADNACSNHKVRNGDAAFLEKGTQIYEIKGYPSALAITASGKVYIVDTNLKAKTAGELYPMDKLVKNNYVIRNEDWKRISSFSEPSKDKLLNEWPYLKLVNPETIDNSIVDDNQVFLEFELNNGVTFVQYYLTDSNTFGSGIVGNEEIKSVIEYELSIVKK